MSEEAKKRFYFIKLKKDFFKRHDVRYLESVSPEYSLIYLKLLCESADHNGELRFNDFVPYTTKMLAVVTDTDPEIFEEAFELLRHLGLVVILDDETIFLPKLCEMVDSYVDSVEANKKRAQRREKNRTKALEKIEGEGTQGTFCPHDVPNDGTNFPENIEYRDKNIPFTNVKGVNNPQEVVNLYSQICHSFPAVKTLTENRKKAIKARLNTYDLDDFKMLFEKAEASSFLKGKNNRNWIATFDWLIKDANMAKVLEGNYDDKPAKSDSKKTGFNDFPHNQYDYEELEKKLIKN